MNKKINPFVHFTPRVLAIIFILFLAMFSLDVFDMNLGIGGIIVGLLMHNIPVFILIALLVVAWKYEIVGGIAFIAGGLFYIGLLIFGGNFQWYMLFWSVQISGPAFLVGILFLIEWFQKKKIKLN
jgi:hypothetical protein